MSDQVHDDAIEFDHRVQFDSALMANNLLRHHHAVNPESHDRARLTAATEAHAWAVLAAVEELRDIKAMLAHVISTSNGHTTLRNVTTETEAHSDGHATG